MGLLFTFYFGFYITAMDREFFRDKKSSKVVFLSYVVTGDVSVEFCFCPSVNIGGTHLADNFVMSRCFLILPCEVTVVNAPHIH